MPAPELHTVVLPTPLPEGRRLGLKFAGTELIDIDYLPVDAPLSAPVNTAEQVLAGQVEGYFQGQALPTPERLPAGTDFQRRVWQALCAIPYGQTRTYGAVAAALGSSARAVAGACRRNPWPILVPCHRVVATHGPGGYSGATAGPLLELKLWLLHHEQGRR